MNRERLVSIKYRLLQLFPDRSPDSGFDSGSVSDYLFCLDWPSLSLGPFDIRSEWTHIYIKSIFRSSVSFSIIINLHFFLLLQIFIFRIAFRLRTGDRLGDGDGFGDGDCSKLVEHICVNHGVIVIAA